MRAFFSTDEPCKAGCLYCFAHWKSEYPEQPLLRSAITDIMPSIIYPNCDGDFFEKKENILEVKKIAKTLEKMYISVSTKRNITPEILHELCDLDSFLREENKGFVKVSVSITTSSMINEIEPYTLPYKKRLQLIKEMSALGFATSVTIKPILPFVPDEEYFSIIDDCKDVVNRILTGGLYVNKDSIFFNKYIHRKYQTIFRNVSWLPEQPKWLYVAQEDKIARIKKYAISKTLKVYESDVDLIKDLI